MEKRKHEFSSPHVRKVVSEETRQGLIVHRARVQKHSSPEYRVTKYTKNNPKHKLWFYKGYDLMQYMIAVKPFIKKKYRIDSDYELEILLYLFPIQFFSRFDMRYIPYIDTHYSLKKLIELNYVEVAIPGENDKKTIYTLTKRSIDAVRDYYAYLSGEKTLKNDTYNNPFKNKDRTKMDGMREKLMVKLKKQAERKPSRFKNHDF